MITAILTGLTLTSLGTLTISLVAHREDARRIRELCEQERLDRLTIAALTRTPAPHVHPSQRGLWAVGGAL